MKIQLILEASVSKPGQRMVCSLLSLSLTVKTNATGYTMLEGATRPNLLQFQSFKICKLAFLSYMEMYVLAVKWRILSSGGMKEDEEEGGIMREPYYV